MARRAADLRVYDGGLAVPLKRPATPAECRSSIRPCPWVSCEAHLLFDVTRSGSISITEDAATRKGYRGAYKLPNEWQAPEVERDFVERALAVLEEMPQTCMQDVIDAHGEVPHHRVGESLNVSRARAQQMEASALRRARSISGRLYADTMDVLDDANEAVTRGPRWR